MAFKKYKKLYIEITNVCNLSCGFCPKTVRNPQFMSIETFEKILDQIKNRANYIYFHVKGEPLLHPQIDEFLDLCDEKGFKVNLITNGTIISKVKSKILMKPALAQIGFSVHSFDENFADKSTGLDSDSGSVSDSASSSKDKYLEDIFAFVHEAIEKTDISIVFKLWNLTEDESTNLKREKNKYILNAIQKQLNLPDKFEEIICKTKGITISDRIYLSLSNEFEWPNLKNEISSVDKAGFCQGLRNQISILVDGTVVPCCLDGDGIIKLGNIHDNSFSEIIDSERAKAIIDGFSRREVIEELCQKCEFRKRFD